MTIKITTRELRDALQAIATEIAATERACRIPPKRGDPERLRRAVIYLDGAIADIDAHMAAS